MNELKPFLYFILALAFTMIVFKLLNLIVLSWVWVLSPIWIPLAIWTALAIIVIWRRFIRKK